MQQYSRLSILAAFRRKGTGDGDIDLASVTCGVHFDRIEIMECELYVWILQFVSANEVGQERKRCRTRVLARDRFVSRLLDNAQSRVVLRDRR